MSIFKSDLFLGLITLVLFGILYLVVTKTYDPAINKIGSGFSTMIDNVFKSIGIS